MLRASIAFVLFYGITAAFVPEKHANWKYLPHDTCGLSKYTTSRIVGGKEAPLGAYPWMVRVGYSSPTSKSVHFCGGVLISEKYVLTAAHCTNQTGVNYGPVRLGEHNTVTDPDCVEGVCATGIIDMEVSSIIMPEGRKFSVSSRDIALVRMKTSVTFSEYVSPICLGNKKFVNQDFTGKLVEVTGWGMNNSTAKTSSKVLLTVKIPVLSLKRCRELYSNRAEIVDSQVCAGVEGRDSCSGDSGGPLMLEDNFGQGTRYYLLGIVSFGPAHCGVANRPGVYTKVPSFEKWILDNIKN